MRSWWMRLNLRSKMILFYLFVVLLPSCLLMYVYYDRSTALLQTEVNNTILQTLKQAELNLSSRLDNVMNVSHALSSNPLLYKYVTRHETGSSRYQHYLDYRELDQLLESLESTPNVHAIRLFVDPLLLYARERVRYFPMEEWRASEWADKVLAGGGVHWTNTYAQPFGLTNKSLVITGSRALQDPTNFDRVIGVLSVDIKEADLASVLSDIELGKEEQLYLLDKDGKVISHHDKRLLGTNMLHKWGLSPDDFLSHGFAEHSWESVPHSLIYQTLPMTGWKLVAEVPEANLSIGSTTFNRISIAVALVGTFILFILIIFLLFASIAEGMSLRIRRLVRTMKQEGLDNLDDSIARNAGDMGTLETSIGRMIETVRSLTESSFQARLQEREATLKALQAQINPHFLYNTLETINWMAIRRNADDISSMISSLAAYFRLTLNKGRDIVRMEEELKMIKVYLDIQQARFQGECEVEYEVAAETEQLLLPKLTLQPIVENALLHGLRSQARKDGRIHIRVDVVDGDLHIDVEDNGIGMPENVLRQLFVKREAEMSYGLYNVNERIRLFAGESYGLHVESKENEGTIVTIRLKAVT